jgi:putative copper resistance protein D
MAATLILARAAYFAAAMLLFGGSAMRRLMHARLPHIAPLPRIALAWPAVAGVAAIVWFALAAAQMAGDPGAALDPSVLMQAALQTTFGFGFLLRMAALLLLGVALTAGWNFSALALSGVALAAPALSGHAAASSPAHFAVIGATIDALHLLTAGFWIGGLALLAMLFARGMAQADLLLTLGLFSEWGMIAVLLLVMTGMINATLVLLGGPGEISILYLGLLATKLACVCAMLALALTNRFRLMPEFTTAKAKARLRRNVTLELGLGILAAALAAGLGQLAPTLG